MNVGYTVTVYGQSPKSNSAGMAYGKDGNGMANAEKCIQEYKDYIKNNEKPL